MSRFAKGAGATLVYAFAIIFIALVGMAALGMALMLLPSLVRLDKPISIFAEGDSAARAFAWLAVYIIAIIGIVLTYRRTKAVEDTLRMTIKSDQNEQLKNGLELLGAEADSTRAGAIILLYYLAKDNPDQFMKVVYNVLRDIRDRTLAADYSIVWVALQEHGQTEKIAIDNSIINSQTQRNSFATVAKLTAKFDELIGIHTLRGKTVFQAVFCDVEFDNLDLSDVSFISCIFISARFTDCTFKNTKFNDAMFGKVIFGSCDLSHAEFNEQPDLVENVTYSDDGPDGIVTNCINENKIVVPVGDIRVFGGKVDGLNVNLDHTKMHIFNDSTPHLSRDDNVFWKPRADSVKTKHFTPPQPIDEE